MSNLLDELAGWGESLPGRRNEWLTEWIARARRQFVDPEKVRNAVNEAIRDVMCLDGGEQDDSVRR